MASPKTTPKRSTKTPKTTAARKLTAPEYKSFRLSKRIKSSKGKLPSGYKLFRQSLRHLKTHWRLFGGILLINAVLSLVLVRGLSSSENVPLIKDTVEQLFPGQTGQVAAGVTVFGFLIGTATSAPSEAANFYQSVLLLLTSLALIWALRQSYAGTKVRVRDAFYKGMYPLIPFLLVLIVIGLQFIPFAIGNVVFSIVLQSGIAVTGLERFIWGTLFFLLATLSLYLVTSSVFALYIATLADMQPLQALSSTKDIVRYRRWQIMRKLLFLPLALLILGAVIFLPIIMYATFLAEWLFFTATIATLAIVHTYLYSLYRELL